MADAVGGLKAAGLTTYIGKDNTISLGFNNPHGGASAEEVGATFDEMIKRKEEALEVIKEKEKKLAQVLESTGGALAVVNDALLKSIGASQPWQGAKTTYSGSLEIQKKCVISAGPTTGTAADYFEVTVGPEASRTSLDLKINQVATVDRLTSGVLGSSLTDVLVTTGGTPRISENYTLTLNGASVVLKKGASLNDVMNAFNQASASLEDPSKQFFAQALNIGTETSPQYCMSITSNATGVPLQVSQIQNSKGKNQTIKTALNQLLLFSNYAVKSPDVLAANFTVNGMTASSPSNTISNIVPGITLTFKNVTKSSDPSFRLKIEEDRETFITQKVKGALVALGEGYKAFSEAVENFSTQISGRGSIQERAALNVVERVKQDFYRAINYAMIPGMSISNVAGLQINESLLNEALQEEGYKTIFEKVGPTMKSSLGTFGKFSWKEDILFPPLTGKNLPRGDYFSYDKPEFDIVLENKNGKLQAAVNDKGTEISLAVQNEIKYDAKRQAYVIEINDPTSPFNTLRCEYSGPMPQVGQEIKTTVTFHQGSASEIFAKTSGYLGPDGQIAQQKINLQKALEWERKKIEKEIEKLEQDKEEMIETLQAINASLVKFKEDLESIEAIVKTLDKVINGTSD